MAQDISRRRFLETSVAVGSVAALPSCGGSPSLRRQLAEQEDGRVFRFGVASGDPLADAVVLWTHISQATSAAAVSWVVATDAELTQVVRRSGDGLGAGEPSTTDSDRDYTFKVDVTGLSAGTTYYYQFEALGVKSPIGRTKTTPSGDNLSERLRFAVCSCSKYHHGYWNVYANIAQQADLDGVIHLGDYYYEEGSKGSAIEGREIVPDIETYTLDEYRERHALFKSDIDLQEAHRQHPFICVWDDHEIADNTWKHGAHRHDEAEHGPYSDRKAAALQSYDEWMPLRTSADGDIEKIYRKFEYGDLMELIMIDARLVGRDQEVSSFNSDGTLSDMCEVKSDQRSILGSEQRDWLLQSLTDSTAKWKVIGNQVMMAQLEIRGADPDPESIICGEGRMILNSDQWDGYRYDQELLLNHLRDNISNTVVLTGDIHSSWANDLTPDPTTYSPAQAAVPANNSCGVEFICPGITSNPNGTLQQFEVALENYNAHVRYLETSSRGYFLLDIDTDRVQAEWNYVETLTERNPNMLPVTNIWKTDDRSAVDGNNFLTEGDAPSAPKPSAAPLAPMTTAG